MIKAIIFDCFGVLVTEGWLAFKAEYFGKDPELDRQAGDLNKQADAGLISHEAFVQSVAKLAGISVADVNKAIDVNAANEALFTYINTQLKPDYKIGMLSNAAANWLQDLFTPEQRKLFDAVSLSYEAGFIKPHHRAYEIIAHQLKVEVEACVFIDDQARHCDGAKAAGMRAILYKDFEQMKAELEKILADSER
ncbi:MAG TPA: HAD-IA family hydrolase [Candidatus Saccharimonadales bacterium]|nr:HAD-IA family hydrolase [Candidatus Saccharimonadales bacterium]